MLLGIGFKVILIATVLLGVLVPARVRMLVGRSAQPAFKGGPFSSHAVIGLIGPLAHLLDLIAIEARVTAAARRNSNIAAAAVFVAPLSAFAVIPFGSRYSLGGHEIDLVVANLDWGIVWLLGAAMLSIYGSIGLVPNVGDRVRCGVVKISWAAGAGFALAALAMVFGSLNPTEIAIAQDQSFSIGKFSGSNALEVQRLLVPGWGMFLQPFSMLLYSVCALGVLQLTAADSSDEPGSRLTGAQYFLVRMSEHLDALLVASVIVALFLGGGALPYVSGSTIVEAIGAYLGTGFATLFCMVVHTSVFFAKVILVVAMIDPIRRRLIGLSFEASLKLCWKVVVPLSLLNLLVTANFLLARGASQ